MTMTKLPLILLVLTSFAWACGGSGAHLEPGTEVTIKATDGTLVTGRVAEPGDTGTEIGAATSTAPRDEHVIPSASTAGDIEPDATPDAAAPVYRAVTLPTGTTLTVSLDSGLASDESRVEDPVRGHLVQAIMVDGSEVAPEGSLVRGSVVSAEPSGNVQGRARVAFRFEQLAIDDTQYDIWSEMVRREARATKGDDAKKIGIGAGAGAVIGGLLGGKKGAGTGAAIGGGAGTAMVLTTAGDEVRLHPGTEITVDLAQPVTLLVP